MPRSVIKLLQAKKKDDEASKVTFGRRKKRWTVAKNAVKKQCYMLTEEP